MALVTVFMDFPTATIIWVVWAIVYQQVENNVIQPQIQKRAVNINPFLVLVSVLFGGTLLGVLGALVAVPVAASLQIALLEYLDDAGIRPRPEDGARGAEPPDPPASRPAAPSPRPPSWPRRRRKSETVAATPPPTTKPATAALTRAGRGSRPAGGASWSAR